MKIAIEEISPVKKTITVEIPEDVVTREFQSAYSDLKRRVKIPGFRPGKAPLSLLETRYAQSVQEDVVRRLVPDYYRRAINEVQISPIELPEIGNIDVKKNAPLIFKATVEIKPSIELGSYLDLKIKSPRLDFKETDIDSTLQALREKYSVLESHPADHAITETDYVLLDFDGSIQGKPFAGGTGQGVTVQVGSKTLVSGFEDQLMGHHAGEQFEIAVTFPADYHKVELAGKPATFKVHIREVKKRVLPDLDDEFAKDVGNFTSLKELKDKIQKDLDTQLQKEEEQARKKALVKRLIELHPFEAPQSLVDREVRDLLIQVQSKLPPGVTLEQARIDSQFVETEAKPTALEKVKRMLILQAIADREGIEISKQELDAFLEKMAEGTKTSPEDLKRLIISRQGSLDGVSEQLRADQALELVYSKTTYE
jgi:trigger factor